MGIADRLVGPQVYETSPEYQCGWAGAEIVSAIEMLTGLLAGPALVAAEDDDWDRKAAIARARSDVRSELRSLRVAFDVLDPTGECSSRKQLTKLDAESAVA